MGILAVRGEVRLIDLLSFQTSQVRSGNTSCANMGLFVLVVAAIAYVIWQKVPDTSDGTYSSSPSKQGTPTEQERQGDGGDVEEKLDTYSDGLKKFVCKLCSREKIVEPEVNAAECWICGKKMALKERLLNDSNYLGRLSKTEDIVKGDSVEDLLTKEVDYKSRPPNRGGNIGSRITCEKEKQVPKKTYRAFYRYFENREIEYEKEKGECYLPPCVAFLREDGIEWLIGSWETRDSLCTGKGIDILNVAYRLGKKASGSEPKAFVLAVDGEIWNSQSRELIFRSSILDGEGSLRSGSVTEKDGNARLEAWSKSSKIDKELDITLSAANAFWIGAGINAQHDGPQVVVKLGSETVNLGTRGFSPDLGSVYVLTNPEIYNVAKIGYTKDSAEKRARQLSGTGVPGEWSVAHEIKTRYPERLEEEVHQKLSDQRVQDNREFFRVDPEEAARVIEKTRD